MAQTEATIESKILKLALFRLHAALMEKTLHCSDALEAVMIIPHLGVQRSGGSDIRGFHDDTCAHLMGVAARRRQRRVLAVGWRPAVGVVADEGGRVSRAGDPEVGLARTDKGGHARKRTCGNPEN